MSITVFLSATALTTLFVYQFLYKFYVRHTYSRRSAKHRHPQNLRSNRKGRHRDDESTTTGEILRSFKESLPDLTREVLISNEGRPTH